MTSTVTIIGGGITGLTAAYRLQQSDAELQITLIERDERLGGKIITVEQDGFIIEGGPDSFLVPEKPWALDLARELGLNGSLLDTNDDRRNIYLLHKSKLRHMPDGLMLVVPTRLMPFVLSPIISLPGKLRMALDLFIPRRQADTDESLASFVRRRLGREALAVLAEPMMAGIHSGDPEQLSLRATFPRFIDLERKYGSLIRGMVASHRLAARKAQASAPPATALPAAALPAATSMFVSMRDGLRELVVALEEALSGVEILTGQGVSALHKLGDGYDVSLQDGSKLHTDAIVLATPAYVAAALTAELNAPLAQELRAIRYASAATISLGFKRTDVPHPLDGYGFVVPSTEPTALQACTWTSTKFDHRAPADTVLLRAFVGGPQGAELVAQDEHELVEIVRFELQHILGIDAEPIVARVFRWDRATPQYDVGHLERVSRLEALSPPGLFLTGSPYRGVGIPDCVRQGSQTAKQVLDYLATVQTPSATVGATS